MHRVKPHEGGNTYASITSIAEDYFGPAAERFIDRIIRIHIRKPKDKIGAEDVREVAAWIKLALGHYTEDEATVHEFMRRLARMAQRHRD